MKITTSDAKRYGVYVFYDKNGIVDEYNDVFLKGLKEVVSHLLIICNGHVNSEGKARLEAIADEVMVRENIGYDVTAYKEGILKPGFDQLCQYDEVVICNDTMYGPLYPFSEMFDHMAGEDLDFWGITNFHQVEQSPFPLKDYDYLPEHIQSFFMVYRQSLTQTKDFQHYWENLPKVTCYEEAIGFHEAIFTQKFADMGYKWAVYADSTDLEGYTYDPLRDFPRYLVAEKRCPVIKKRSFYHEYGEAMERSGGEATREVLEYIQKNLPYNTDLIWKNLIRTQNMADLKKRMQLNYVLSSKLKKPAKRTGLSIALVIHLYYEDMAQVCRAYAESMPEGTDVYITVPNQEKKEIVEQAFEGFSYTTQIRITGPKGRDVAPFLVGCKDLIDKYDLICKIHGKKVNQVAPMSLGHFWAQRSFDSLLKNNTYVENVITTFEENPFLGMLTPPIPNHGPYYPTIGKGEWGENYRVAKELASTLHLHVDVNPDKEPVAPFGSMFWARSAALKPLFAHDWRYDEMPEEPLADDSTVLHAIERIYPFCVQEAGYYPAWILSDFYAKVEIDNLKYMNRELVMAEFSVRGAMPFRQLMDAVHQSEPSVEA